MKRRIRVGAEPWSLELVQNVAERAADDGLPIRVGESYYGLTIPSDRLILIESGHSARLMTDTLVHELIHASMPRFHERTVLALAAKMTPTLMQFGLKLRDRA